MTEAVSAEAVAEQMRKYAKEADQPVPPECIVTPQSYEFEEWADFLTSLAAELAQCREALKFYATEANWEDGGFEETGPGQITHTGPSAYDCGRRARTALKGASHESDA